MDYFFLSLFQLFFQLVVEAIGFAFLFLKRFKLNLEFFLFNARMDEFRRKLHLSLFQNLNRHLFQINWCVCFLFVYFVLIFNGFYRDNIFGYNFWKFAVYFN